MPKQGDIVSYLGLRKNEIERLRFLDDTETLYLIPTGRIVEKLSAVQDKGVSAKDADRELAKFFEQGRPLK